jgi:hypothetical protein
MRGAGKVDLVFRWIAALRCGISRCVASTNATREIAKMDHCKTVQDYYVRTWYQQGWSWEICRRSKPMGVRLGGANFATEKDAMQAGRQELANFLLSHARDMKRAQLPQKKPSTRPYTPRVVRWI